MFLVVLELYDLNEIFKISTLYKPRSIVLVLFRVASHYGGPDHCFAESSNPGLFIMIVFSLKEKCSRPSIELLIC